MDLENVGIVALQLVANQSRCACDDTTLGAIVSCGIIDLDTSVTAYHDAQQKADLARVEIDAYEVELAELKEKKERLEAKKRDLMVQERELSAITPLGDATDMVKVLFSLVNVVKLAITFARGYLAEKTGFSNYFLPLLERFVRPALENQLPQEWSADEMWQSVVDTQITQCISPSYRGDDELPLKKVLAQLKNELSPERVHAIVVGICASEKCDANELKKLIAQLHEKMPE
jgi:hypothetical protein